MYILIINISRRQENVPKFVLTQRNGTTLQTNRTSYAPLRTR